MIDGTNSSEIKSPSVEPTTTSQESLLGAKEMGAIATAVETSFQSVPEFSERMIIETELAKKIIEGVKTGEINEEIAVKIIAVGRTELAMATETDSLTELPNRPAIERIMGEQVSLAKRNGSHISIAFVDLDKFKDINDRYTHDAGDAVLQAVGGYLKTELKRPTDKAGRWGGEEFIIVLPDTNEKGADLLLNDLRKKMNTSVSEAVFEVGGYEFDREITPSIGFVTATIDRNDTRTSEDMVSELVSTADKRVLLAKGNGRNRVVGSLQEKDLVHQV